MDVASYLERLLRKDVLLSLLGLYLAQLVVYRAYKIFIYPYFVSPLRQLPGPKVRSAQLRTMATSVRSHELMRSHRTTISSSVISLTRFEVATPTNRTCPGCGNGQGRRTG